MIPNSELKTSRKLASGTLILFCFCANKESDKKQIITLQKSLSGKMDFANFIGVVLESSLEHNYQRIELISTNVRRRKQDFKKCKIRFYVQDQLNIATINLVYEQYPVTDGLPVLFAGYSFNNLISLSTALTKSAPYIAAAFFAFP